MSYFQYYYFVLGVYVVFVIIIFFCFEVVILVEIVVRNKCLWLGILFFRRIQGLNYFDWISFYKIEKVRIRNLRGKKEVKVYFIEN